MACAGVCGRPSVAPGRSREAGAVPNLEPEGQPTHREEARPHPCCSPAPSAASPTTSASSCAAWPTRGCPSPAGATSTRPACARSGSGSPAAAPAATAPTGLALARRRTSLLRSLCDAGRLTEAEGGLLQLTDLGREFLDLPDAAQLGFVFAAWWEGVDWGDWAPRAELGRLLWHERDTLVQELAGLPPGQVDLAGFARRFRALVAHRWPSMLAAADPAEWRQALWSTALAPLAMLGALDIPARMSPSPAWFALTGTAPALVAAAAAMCGPEPPASLAAATQN